MGNEDCMKKEEQRAERELLFLQPVCTKNVWGGSRLRDEFHCEGAGDHAGECWGISAHPVGDGTVREGRFAGEKLSAVWERHRELFGGYPSEDFPMLVKILDAKDDLSIQVHPDDAYAGVHENGASGKTESWYILDCKKDASIVVGHNAKTGEELASMVSEGRWSELIREVPVKKGDFIQINPGTVHAIRGGVLLLETQQSSDVTYRLYDYDRLWNGSLRELHIPACMDVITVPAIPVSECMFHPAEGEKNQIQRLYECGYYRMFRLVTDGTCHPALTGAEDRISFFLLVSVIDGEGSVDGHPVRKGDHFIVPHGYGRPVLSGRMELVMSEPV